MGEEAGLQFAKKDAMIQTRGSNYMSISSPIEQRNTGKGNPNAILMFDRPLNARQVKLLEKLPALDSCTEVPKRDVNMKDLAALTAHTGCEFALFTKGNQRFIIRGNAFMVNVTEEKAQGLAEAGYRWSGHTHPGEGINVRMASPGDKAVLRQFAQTVSAIWDQHGRYLLFGKDE